MASLSELVAVLHAHDSPELEVLVLMDNRRRFLGEKRNALIRMARGKFIANVDDDDLVAPNYFAALREALTGDVDLVAYDATCSLNGARPFRVNTGLDFENEQPQHIAGGYSDIRRKPWSWCCWRRELALQCKFPEYHDGAEDWTWITQALPLVKTWRKVDAPLYYHRYNISTSAFPTS